MTGRGDRDSLCLDEILMADCNFLVGNPECGAFPIFRPFP